MGRPSWDEYFAGIARQVATRSTCIRPDRQVGAVVVKEKRILTTGYNGAPSGLPHCAEVGCLRQERNVPSGQQQEICRGVHAEQNAIIQAALHGVSIAGADIYLTHTPCITCAKMIINAGIKRVFCLNPYPDELALQILQKAGVELVMMKGDQAFQSAEAA